MSFCDEAQRVMQDRCVWEEVAAAEILRETEVEALMGTLRAGSGGS